MVGGAVSGGMVVKPRELGKIERYIEVEWRRRKCRYEEWTDARFEMFRDSFEAVNRAFTTWAPMLLAIKREYDGWVAHITEENERLRIVEKKLISVEEDQAEKVFHIRREADETVLALVSIHHSTPALSLIFRTSQSINR